MILPSPRSGFPAVVRIGGMIAVVYCQSVNLNAELLTSATQSFCPTSVRLASFQIRLGPAVRKEKLPQVPFSYVPRLHGLSRVIRSCPSTLERNGFNTDYKPERTITS